jgi:hypothetical protein
MPLNLPEPPRGVPEAVRSKLEAFAENAAFSTPALRGARREQLGVSTPHQIYTMGLADIEAGGGLDRARPVGWRYLIEADGEVIASAETAPARDGTQELSQFNEGPFVAGTATAVRNARALPQLATAGFELRLLRIPALYLMALWLHSANADLLIPLVPSPIGKEGQVVPPAQLFRELSEHARGRSTPSRPDQPGGPGGDARPVP